MTSVRKLFTSTYDDTGRHRQDSMVADPVWDDVARLIGQLDRFHTPYVWLYFDPHAGEDSLPDFEVLGGAGAYVMCQHDPGSGALFYFNADGSDSLVDVWTSDQGASFPSREVCFDIALVIQATKHFFEFGTLDPSMRWQRSCA